MTEASGEMTPAMSNGAAPRMSRRAWVLRAIGLLVVVGLVVSSRDVVLASVDVLGGVDPGIYLLGLLLYVLGLAVSAFRAHTILIAFKANVTYGEILSDFLKATALNASFAMGAGELYRVNRLRKSGLDLGTASAAVVLDRGVGLATVALAGLSGAAISGAHALGVVISPMILTGSILAGVLTVVAGIRLLKHRLPKALIAIAAPPVLLRITLACLAVLGFWIASVWVFAQALGINVAIGVIAFAAPLVTLATLLPISIGGIGLREAGYALLLAPYGVASSEAVALGLVQYTSFLLVAGLCWMLLLTKNDREVTTS